MGYKVEGGSGSVEISLISPGQIRGELGPGLVIDGLAYTGEVGLVEIPFRSRSPRQTRLGLALRLS